VRYLTLAEAFIIAEDVTGIDAHVLVTASRSDENRKPVRV